MRGKIKREKPPSHSIIEVVDHAGLAYRKKCTVLPAREPKNAPERALLIADRLHPGFPADVIKGLANESRGQEQTGERGDPTDIERSAAETEGAGKVARSQSRQGDGQDIRRLRSAPSRDRD